MLFSILVSPIENIRIRIPPKISPLLKKKADMPSIPKSLNALCVHLNQEASNIASQILKNIIIGINTPQIPASIVIFIFFIICNASQLQYIGALYFIYTFLF